MSRILIFAYGVASYVVFLGVFVYAIAFLGNFYIPNSIDADPAGPVRTALIVNLALLSGFAVQHSLMARPFFKRWWTSMIPPAAERSTYILFSNLAMIALFLWWQPIGGVVWDINAQPSRSIILAIYFIGWAILFYATCLLNHFELFGLRQVWHHLRGLPQPEAQFREPGMYKHVRHPIYVGWLIIFWATPTMTMAHLLFAVVTSLYILVAVQFEEHDLVKALGDDYRNYKRRVPMILPLPRRKRSGRAVQAS
ncbi:MAG: methanethiol S-methyltransferase [Pseudomonadota bacterium]